MKRFVNSLILVFAVIFTGSSVNSEKNRLDLSKLSGHWEGQGSYILPFTNIPTTVNASGVFKYDSTSNILHTQFYAERFMIKYSDSGRLAYVENSDSITWDVWNSFGYYVQYKGKVDGKKIHGKQKMGKYIYDLYLEIITNDSLDILIRTTDKDGDTSDRITGYMRKTAIDSAREQ